MDPDNFLGTLKKEQIIRFQQFHHEYRKYLKSRHLFGGYDILGGSAHDAQLWRASNASTLTSARA